MKLIPLFLLCFLFSTDVQAARLLIESFHSIDMSRPSGQCGNFDVVLTKNINAFCALTRVGGSLQGGGEFGQVFRVNSTWRFHGSSCQPGVIFDVHCVVIGN
jgi:hypothetical protein